MDLINTAISSSCSDISMRAVIIAYGPGMCPRIVTNSWMGLCITVTNTDNIEGVSVSTLFMILFNLSRNYNSRD